MKRTILIFFAAFTIPAFLGLTVWQSTRYTDLKTEIGRQEQVQADWLESNRKLITGIAVLTSTERIEHIAVNVLNLRRIRPENVLQINVEAGKAHEF